MFERHQGGNNAILVHVAIASRVTDADIEEFRSLALSAGASPVAFITGKRPHPEPKFLIGASKAEEIRDAVLLHKADLVLLNHQLSPSQERNLEKLLECRVLDRTGLILDIFAQRAQSHEGRLQVELAQLKHMATRLVRGWTHLERQKGGIGLRGPGETQLETDRRLLDDRIKLLVSRLEKVRNQRQQGRKSRKKAQLPTLSLVGYTNAGKSRLFNCLTSASVYTADQLFATLDPTLRRLDLQPGSTVILADTVGFIRDLPHELVDAFHSTLEETREAELLLQVVDASDPLCGDYQVQVNSVLAEIGAADIPQLLVFNKIDLLPDVVPKVDYDETGRPWRVWVSAATGAGIPLLLDAVAVCLSAVPTIVWLKLTIDAGKLRAWIYQHAEVLEEKQDGNEALLLKVKITRPQLDKITDNPLVCVVPLQTDD